jgi:hypothetical protein
MIQYNQIDLQLTTIPNGSITERFQTETYELIDDEYKEHSKEKKMEEWGRPIVTLECKIKKRMRSQNTIYSAEQEAIIKTIRTTRKSNKKMVILTDSLNTLMAVPAIQKIQKPEYLLRKMLDEEGKYLSSVY